MQPPRSRHARPYRATVAIAAVVALCAVGTAAAALPVEKRVLQRAELRGFWLDDPVVTARTAKAWFEGCDSCSERIAAMRARGFVAGARQHLNGNGAEAFSSAIRFGSARGAAATLDEMIPSFRAGSSTLSTFRIAGIRGAQAAEFSNIESTGILVAFVDGTSVYQLLVLSPRSSKTHPARATVIAGARALYRRVRGR